MKALDLTSATFLPGPLPYLRQGFPRRFIDQAQSFFILRSTGGHFLRFDKTGFDPGYIAGFANQS